MRYDHRPNWGGHQRQTERGTQNLRRYTTYFGSEMPTPAQKRVHKKFRTRKRRHWCPTEIPRF